MPHIVLNVVENMFPYTDSVRGSFVALECVMELQRQSNQLQMEQDEEIADIERQMADENCSAKAYEELEQRLGMMRPPNSYILDIAQLEYMASTATRKNHVGMMLVIWDALELMGLKPTETIYESTVLCFMQNSNLVENSFVVMRDMEDAGFVPSQALVKGAALALR